MMNFQESGANGRVSLFVAPHPAFALANDRQQHPEQEWIGSDDDTLRSTTGSLDMSSAWNAPSRKITRAVLVGSAMLVALVAVIVAVGPIQTPGPSGVSLRHAQVTPAKVQYSALIAPAHITGR